MGGVRHRRGGRRRRLGRRRRVHPPPQIKRKRKFSAANKRKGEFSSADQSLAKPVYGRRAIPAPPKRAADKAHTPRSGMQLRASHRGGCARTMRPHPRRPHGGRLPLAHTLTTFSYGIRRGFGRGGYRRFRGSVLAGRLREVLRQEAGAFRGERFSGALRGDSIGKTESAPAGRYNVSARPRPPVFA